MYAFWKAAPQFGLPKTFVLEAPTREAAVEAGKKYLTDGGFVVVQVELDDEFDAVDIFANRGKEPFIGMIEKVKV